MSPAALAPVALLTGAKRIGAVVADRLAAHGYDIVVSYRGSQAEADAIVKAVTSTGRRALAIKADVANPEAVTTMLQTIEAEFGRLDVVVNMASMYDKVALADVTADAWHRQLAVDLDGTSRVTLAALPLLRRSGRGRIVNFTDWVAASSRPRYAGYLAYYVAKAGVKAFTEALALEVAKDNILVNAVAPGPILAPDDTTAEERAAVERATPLGRWGGAEEIAKTVMFLVETDFITGETIRVDGGRHLY
jgi:3-oxoacyl-[acyl-carrier protein] reductase